MTAGMKNKRQAQTRWLIFSTTDPLNVLPAAASDDAPAAPRLFQRLESSPELWSGGTSRLYHLAPFKTPVISSPTKTSLSVQNARGLYRFISEVAALLSSDTPEELSSNADTHSDNTAS